MTNFRLKKQADADLITSVTIRSLQSDLHITRRHQPTEKKAKEEPLNLNSIQSRCQLIISSALTELSHEGFIPQS